MKISLIIPIYKPNSEFIELLSMLKKQTVKDFELIIIETVSENTIDYSSELQGFNIKTKKIQPSEFGHGKTRQWAVDIADNPDIVIMMTQDAIPADEYTIENLVKVFQNEKIGCAYGRQLPKTNATPIAAHARLFNYPDNSYVRSFADKEKYKIKTVFSSDSFAAYRVSALNEVGGFPKNNNVSEDMYVTAKMCMGGWLVAYCAEAKVYHSHNYSLLEEYKRYKKIGAFNKEESWIRDTFGRAEGEGIRFIKSEIKYIMRKNPVNIVDIFFRNILKLAGYKLL